MQGPHRRLQALRIASAAQRAVALPAGGGQADQSISGPTTAAGTNESHRSRDPGFSKAIMDAQGGTPQEWPARAQRHGGYLLVRAWRPLQPWQPWLTAQLCCYQGTSPLRFRVVFPKLSPPLSSGCPGEQGLCAHMVGCAVEFRRGTRT